LSLTSIKERKKNAQAERSKDKAFLAKYAKFDITLDDSQHNEMCKITTELDKKHRNQLEAVYKEDGGSKSTLPNIWGTDKQQAELYKDQVKDGVQYFVMNSYYVHHLFIDHGK